MTIEAFYSPESVREAVAQMRDGAGRGAFVAGGTDLLCRPERPDFVVNVRGLLNTLTQDEDGFVLGASAPLSDLEDWPELATAAGGLLGGCLKQFGSRHIRNMATVGGNLANASPAADLAPPLLVLEAACQIEGPHGAREVLLENFFTGPGRHVLAPDELLVAVRVPAPAPGARGAFLKLCANPGAIAALSAAAVLELDGDTVRRARIALGSAAPTPLCAPEAEAYLAGKPATPEHFARAAERARAAARPIADQRASAEYRRQMCGVLVRRALARCTGSEDA